MSSWTSVEGGSRVHACIHPDMWQPNSSSSHIMDSNQLVSCNVPTETIFLISSIFTLSPHTRTRIFRNGGCVRVRTSLTFLFVFQIRYARFLRTYAKTYCTETTVSPFLIYFPFILFLVPSLIIFIEKGLKRYICHILFRDYGIEELPPDIQKFLFQPPATKILLNLRSCRSILQGDHGGQ